METQISKSKLDDLEELMQELNILEKDIVESFVTGWGKGGQKINKTASCVVLKHIPTGIIVKCQTSRFRELNRYYARKILCERIITTNRNEEEEERVRLHRLTHNKRKRPLALKNEILNGKKRTSRKKMLRNKILPSDEN